MYKAKTVPTLELINKYEEEGYFFRFQNPQHRLTSRSKSWGMVYGSAREAIRDGSVVLSGKSCVTKAKALMEWSCYYDNNYVVLVFKGYDTYETGHDGEDVATYSRMVDVFSYDDFLSLYVED